MENGFDRTTPRVYCLGVMEVELAHPIGLPLIERAIGARPSPADLRVSPAVAYTPFNGVGAA